MRAVNLLPRELAADRRGLPPLVPRVGAAAVPVIAIVLVSVGYSHAHSTVTSEKAQLAAIQAAATAATTETPAAVERADAGLIAVRGQRLAALQSVLGKQVAWDITLAQISRLLPAGVWLNSLNAQSPTPEDSSAAGTTPTPPPAGGTTTPTGFTINGFARTNGDVALLLQRLQLLPTLTGVTLGSVTGSTVGTTPAVSFTITAGVQPGPGSGSTATTSTPAATTPPP